MKNSIGLALTLLSAALASVCLFSCTRTADIPLPEHPRPDFERAAFVNLNGPWQFTFDSTLAASAAFDKTITVPFPWGSELSGVEDEADVAWYSRSIKVPSSWKGKRVFVVVGACDYQTTAWIDGEMLGEHSGGYIPFEFELTDKLRYGEEQELRFKVDDRYEPWHLYGKQGYGNARGIWQTVYLEARGSNYISSLHFTPDIDSEMVKIRLELSEDPAEGTELVLRFRNGEQADFRVALDSKVSELELPLENQHLWTLEDPYLYEVGAAICQGGKTVDEVDSYFGQRSIGWAKVPGQDYNYVSLNGKPIYLQLCLDQSYHPEGFYTFPSDEFMRDEIQLSKDLGLNGNRVHIKVEIPRKLYWADRLGLLIMADVPNYWGEPCAEAAADWENTMRAQVERDFNHPSIFAWVDFNETWGLFTKDADGNRTYAKETQEWVRDMYRLTKELDPTRLVEDNSPCNNDHVQTDINSWHAYRAGYNWESTAARYDGLTFPGSSFNYTEGNAADEAPMINSECGNVWGYVRSAGDCDYTWDYHEMMNAFHRHPKIGGWLYTEHHDVINEWNGYVRFDRSAKIDGLDAFVPGMSIRDFHSLYYVVPQSDLCTEAAGGSTVSVDILSSFMTDVNPGEMILETRLVGLGEDAGEYEGEAQTVPVRFQAFGNSIICTREIAVPAANGLYWLQMVLRTADGDVLHRNFALYRVKDSAVAKQGETVLPFGPASYSSCEWSVKHLDVLDGLKANGFGSGWFEYKLHIPEDLAPVESATLCFEASAKQLFGKDVEDGESVEGDFMLGHGTFDPCKVPNAYSMTDTRRWRSVYYVEVDGARIATGTLEDDPADHRGALSWHSQLHDRLLREAGSYGYLCTCDIPAGSVKAGEDLVIRIGVPEDAISPECGGIAIYGKDFGRYPFDPFIKIKHQLNK